jgi:Zn-dependent peptidase ImmA (M78 family)/transcriptional regulator with XRE-family HTH domain
MDSFGARLKAARKMAGMSMQALSDATNNAITKQAISKFEKGQMSPASDTLIALANALKVKTDYFYRESKVQLTGLEFRKKSRLKVRDEKRAKYQTMDFLERYNEIESVMGLEASFDNPLSNIVINEPDDVEKAAMDLRQAWNLDVAPVSKLMELLESKGVRVFEVVDAPEKFDGLSAMVDGIPVIAVNKDYPLDRKRLTVIHELGHQLLRFQGFDNREIESLCHNFANVFLMPTNVLIDEIGSRRRQIALMELKKLKGIYGISIMALMVRAYKLGIISKNYYGRFFMNANKKGWRSGIDNEPGEYIGKEHPNRFRQLVERAVAEEIISMSKGAELMNIGLVKFKKRFQLAA